MNPIMSLMRAGIALAVFVALSLSQPAAAATLAGKVVFARGAPQAVDTAGTSRTLSKGSEVYAGDTLVTGSGRLQVSFVDGAFVSVQPNSQFKIDTYKYNGKPDGTESALYDLLKGGVRAVTGLIGKVHPETFKVHTAVATIGIRGTGFSSRLCAGDCPGKKNGLYHYTWEGTTYVFNNVQSRDVPSGSGVYVQSINSPIQILAQPPAVTAVDTGTKRQEKQRDTEDTTTVVETGNQRTAGGTQTAVTGTAGGGTLQVLTGLGAEHVNTDLAQPSQASLSLGGLSDVSGFLNANGQLIGGLFTEKESNCTTNCTHRQLATVDVNTMLQGGDPLAVAEAQALLAGGDQSVITQAEASPGQVAEFFTNGTIGWTRWEGDVLLVDDTGTTSLFQQVDNQSVHLIFGTPLTAPLPTSGGAVYTFMGGTQSTSLSGATIGKGVTSGSIVIPDFSSAQAVLEMEVSHVFDYIVAGLLSIGTGGGLHGVNVVATTGTSSSSACFPSCAVLIDGGFAGSSTNGLPEFAGIAYSIQETDPVIGVAAFSQGGSVAALQVLTGLVGGHINVDSSNPTAVDAGGISNLTGFTNANGDIIGGLFTQTNNCPSNCVSRRAFATVDLNSMLLANDPAAVSEVESLLAGGDQNLIAQAQANPAHVAESFTNGSIGWARWTGGDVLLVQDDGTTDINPQTGYQSIHLIFGPQLTSPLPTSGSATYTFIGGTQSTSLSGATIGQGVTSGTISISDFSSATADLNMQVVHGDTYNVSGTLSINTNSSNGGLNPINVTASTAMPDASSACSPSCATDILGGFSGPITGGIPEYIGINYTIQEHDPIIGVAAFKGP